MIAGLGIGMSVNSFAYYPTYYAKILWYGHGYYYVSGSTVHLCENAVASFMYSHSHSLLIAPGCFTLPTS